MKNCTRYSINVSSQKPFNEVIKLCKSVFNCYGMAIKFIILHDFECVLEK